MITSKVREQIELLAHPRSPKRRSAARNLRKLGVAAAGPALQTALEAELKDSRTWETQYQLVMAIGHCSYEPALPLIQSLISKGLGGMIDVALGDTLLRLSQQHPDDVDACLALLTSRNHMQIHGALQAIAINRLVPNESSITRLIEYGSSLDPGQSDWSLVWLLRAAPGWPVDLIQPLLRNCRSEGFRQQQQIQGALDLAVRQEYFKWSPL